MRYRCRYSLSSTPQIEQLGDGREREKTQFWYLILWKEDQIELNHSDQLERRTIWSRFVVDAQSRREGNLRIGEPEVAIELERMKESMRTDTGCFFQSS